MAFTKDSLIGDILKTDPQLAKYLYEIGMHCLGCPASRSETIGEACEAHGTDPDELLKKLNGEISE